MKTESRAGQSAGRTSAEGHPSSNASAVLGGREDPIVLEGLRGEENISEPALATHRFYRGRNKAESGSGRGLMIASETAARFGVELTLTKPHRQNVLRSSIR